MLPVPSFGGLDNSTMRGELAECERKSLHARTQKLDLERSIDDPTPAPFGDDKSGRPTLASISFPLFRIQYRNNGGWMLSVAFAGWRQQS
jgi:hypothetical protein